MNKNQGFTLIELLVVVLIIGILSVVALPQYQNAVEKSRASEALSILKTLREQQALCVLAHGESDSCATGTGNIGKSWNNANDNLFTVMDIELPGDVDPGCGSDLCGPATKYFTYAMDVRDIVAIRRPSGSKYLLVTNAWPGDGWRNRIWCLNSDAKKNWCKAIGFTKEDGGTFFQP